ncbi:unnamed protein product, partial [Prunus brigantina]
GSTFHSCLLPQGGPKIHHFNTYSFSFLFQKSTNFSTHESDLVALAKGQVLNCCI